VPLVISAPGRFAPRRVAASVSLVDILPTLVDLAGGDSAALGASVDGRSLIGHLRGEDGHDEVIGEYLAESAIAPMVMIRRGNWKFIHSAPDPDQLYDLSADPGERDNLAGLSVHAERVAEFRREVGRRWNLSALDAAVRESQRRRRFVDSALTKGEAHSWDFQPYREASRSYVRNTIPLDDLEAMARFPRVDTAD
jgi:choline-sulfatase